ncbi:MAG: RluA family pseudouridine synthase [Chlamydiia bacterium]|nr:RluA family pseudouridine synthase [Chlamydiia bacterium]
MAQETISLLEALKIHYPDTSNQKLRLWIQKGRILVDGVVNRRPHDRVKSEQKITRREEREQLPYGIRILYEDEDLVVVDKPEGVLSVDKDRGGTPSLHKILKEHYAPNRVYVVHRLDREASGAIVFALSEKALWSLKDAFASHSIERIYLAVIEGQFMREDGCFESYLKEEPSLNVYSVHSSDTEGDHAITHFSCTGTNGAMSVLQLRLETGKKHQIRVHCKESGHPIVGDARYGSKESPIKRLCLHAHYLSFAHPVSGNQVSVLCEAPAGMQRLIEKVVRGGRREI